MCYVYYLLALSLGTVVRIWFINVALPCSLYNIFTKYKLLDLIQVSYVSNFIDIYINLRSFG